MANFLFFILVSLANGTKSKDETKITSVHQSFDSPLNKVTNPLKNTTDASEEFGDDFLDEFLESDTTKSSATDFKQSTLKKSKEKQSSFQNKDAECLDDFGIYYFSRSSHIFGKIVV